MTLQIRFLKASAWVNKVKVVQCLPLRGQVGGKLCLNIREEYDVIVVGAGHAGCEAALAAARMGLNTICLPSAVRV